MTKYINLTNQNDSYVLSGKLLDNTSVNGVGGDDRIVDTHVGAQRSWLYGGDGNDVIIGGSATFGMYGGAGDDFIAVKGHTTHVQGDAGYDIVQLNTELYDLLGDQGMVSLGSGQPSAGLLNEAGLTYDPAHFLSLSAADSVERMQTAIYAEGTSRGGLDLIGDNVANVLRGGAASNVIHGAGGNDTLLGFGGADRLYGGADDDSLNGGLGADILSGGSGNDTLFLDEGDTGTGGSGRDHFQASSGSFTITDFTKGSDQLALQGAASVVASDGQHLVYTVNETAYQISFGGKVDVLGLSIGHGAGSDIVY